jgi:cyclopropane-fatty-acyl-phospholipid synthase
MNMQFVSTRPDTQTGQERRIQRLLALCDVEIGGNRPWDLSVHDKRLFSRVLAQGSLGLGEAYMHG